MPLSIVLVGCSNKDIKFELNNESKEEIFTMTCTKQKEAESVSIVYSIAEDETVVGVKTTTTVNLNDYSELEKEEYIETINSFYDEVNNKFISYSSELTENEFTYTITIEAKNFTGNDWRKTGIAYELLNENNYLDANKMLNQVEQNGFSCQ